LFGAHPSLGLYMYNNDIVGQPPPAHTGIPPLHVDPKTGTTLWTSSLHEKLIEKGVHASGSNACFDRRSVGNRCHFVLLDNDESCPTADRYNIGRSNGPAYSTGELLNTPQKHVERIL